MTNNPDKRAVVEELAAQLLSATKDYVAEIMEGVADRLALEDIKAADLDEIESYEQAVTAVTTIKGANALAKKLDVQRREILSLVEKTTGVVNAAFGGPIKAAEASVETMKDALDLYLSDEEAKGNAVEVRDEYGHVAYREKTWAFSVVDMGALPKDCLKVHDATVRAEIRAAVKRGKVPSIPGVRVFQITKTKVV